MKINLHINNEEVETDQYSEVRDPGRLSDVVGLVGQGTVQHVEQAVQAAYQAYLTWRKTSIEERVDLLLKAAAVLEQEASSLAVTVSRENGMLLNTTKLEIALAVAAIRNTVGFADSFFRPRQLEDEAGLVRIERRPIGVIAAIVPWNAPMILTMQKLAPAVLCGNTVVFKPSPFAPMGVTIALQKISQLLPPGVINVIHGEGDVGSALTTHPLVRKISFTGGAPTAKHVMRGAAESLKGVHFELGGNDPAIVLDDANLDEIVPKITTAVFRRSGQYCFCIKRIYVPDSMYDSFYEKMIALSDDFKIGHQLNESATFGPLINKQQLQFVQGLVERIKNSNATLTELGKKLEPDNWNNGNYLHPVVVRDVDPNQEIVTCEQFGPVIPLIRYRTEEEALQMANNTEYGLGSSVWSGDFERALRFADGIEAGMTFINGTAQTPLGHKYMPFGGVKQSGIGVENSEAVLGEYTEYHSVNYHKTK